MTSWQHSTGNFFGIFPALAVLVLTKWIHAFIVSIIFNFQVNFKSQLQFCNLYWQQWNKLRLSAVKVHQPHAPVLGIEHWPLHTFVVTSSYFSDCCLPVISVCPLSDLWHQPGILPKRTEAQWICPFFFFQTFSLWGANLRDCCARKSQ